MPAVTSIHRLTADVFITAFLEQSIIVPNLRKAVSISPINLPLNEFDVVPAL